ncbi:hypothetical protein BOTBODRAFT_189844 [Botryobasidium botryosum FD-172 SS1]|uniref:Uncharacterized protein n=1 Tax=Botryobasidium botryosum (strain FD-172 SS1) TaxID=930990 RepID=A0A067M7F7_BOTB1|nr:hypothetical protein BOTBODRAFT_189844 [Botryobasidium botryosum FD-172 SS1]
MAERSLIFWKGIADIIVGGILTFKPSIIYDSPVPLYISNVTGLHRSDPTTAPGFNQAIAIMVAAIGIGHVRASRSHSRDAHATMLLMNVTWSALCLLTCYVNRDIGSATMLMTGINHLAFSTAMFLTSKIRVSDLFAAIDASSGGKRTR